MDPVSRGAPSWCFYVSLLSIFTLCKDQSVLIKSLYFVKLTCFLKDKIDICVLWVADHAELVYNLY